MENELLTVLLTLIGTQQSLMLEYSLWFPVVDDLHVCFLWALCLSSYYAKLNVKKVEKNGSGYQDLYELFQPLFDEVCVMGLKFWLNIEV